MGGGKTMSEAKWRRGGYGEPALLHKVPVHLNMTQGPHHPLDPVC